MNNLRVNKLSQDIEHLKHWISKQPHLTQCLDSSIDDLLLKFLNGCKFDVERCKKVLDKYYWVRNVAPEIFSERDPASSEIKQSMKNATGFILPNLTDENYYVAFGTIFCDDAKDLNAELMVKRFFLSLDYVLHHQKICSGIILLINAGSATLSHLFRFTPTLLKHSFDCVQDCYPLPLKAIHFVDAPSYIDIMISTIKPFLKEKIRNRIQVHHDLESLHKYIAPKILPEELGGTAGTIQELNDSWQKKLEDKRDWFIMEEQRKSDETKRLTEILHSKAGNQYGVEGSFRKLNLD